MLFIVSVKMKALTYRYSYDRVKRKSEVKSAQKLKLICTQTLLYSGFYFPNPIKLTINHIYIISSFIYSNNF